MRAFIYTGGEIFADGITERPEENDLILAADAGYLNAKKFGIVPHLLLGDFDSLGEPEVADGVELLRKIATLGIEFEVYNRKTALLDYARRKTTQKVNLYEKVQIPGYEDAIRKIKRFMEDEENLSKSAQKIVKTRQQAAAKEGGER